MLELSTPIKFVKRVGERVAVELAKRGVETVEDLLYHLPFRYEDRLNPVPMSALKAGTMASVIGEVRGLCYCDSAYAALRDDRGAGAEHGEVHVVSRDVSAGQVSRRTDGGAVRKAGAFAVERGQVQDDSAAV